MHPDRDAVVELRFDPAALLGDEHPRGLLVLQLESRAAVEDAMAGDRLVLLGWGVLLVGIDSDFGRSYAKSQIQACNSLPTAVTLLASVKKAELYS